MPSIRFSFNNFQSQIQRIKLSIVVTTRLLAIVNVAKDFNFRALKPIWTGIFYKNMLIVIGLHFLCYQSQSFSA